MVNDEIEKRTGLKLDEIKLINRIVFESQSVQDAVLFGSRAKGNYKKFSDIDICLTGENVPHGDIVRIINKLEDSSLPYTVDVICYSAISNSELKDHIKRVGISLRSYIP